MGGGLALSIYTGKLRYTKDVDIYIQSEHRQAVVEALTRCGLADYYDTQPYDRNWIYRGYREGVIVDAIWAMANHRAEVDEKWIQNGAVISLFGHDLKVIPPEELIWSKLYVLQRDRCDWPDILNLMNATGPFLDWDHLFDRVGDDVALLKGVLSVFSWVNPQRAMELPRWIWECLSLPLPKEPDSPDASISRADLLDSRPWFWRESAAA